MKHCFNFSFTAKIATWIHYTGSVTYVLSLKLSIVSVDIMQTHPKGFPLYEMVSQMTGISIIYWTVCSGADQRKLQSSASLTFVRGIHQWPVDSPHKGQVTPFEGFPFYITGLLPGLSETPFTDKDRIKLKTRIGNHLHDFSWEVITHTWPNSTVQLNG